MFSKHLIQSGFHKQRNMSDVRWAENAKGTRLAKRLGVLATLRSADSEESSFGGGVIQDFSE